MTHDKALPSSDARTTALLRRGRQLEAVTLAWNVAGIVIVTIAALRAHSVALAGFGLDSLIEIGASTVVLWELSGAGVDRQRRSLRLIAAAFLALAAYLTIQTFIVFATGYHPGHRLLGIAWTALTAAAMVALAAAKNRTGHQLANPVLITEGHVTLIDGLLAVAVLLGLLLNATFGWRWADPAAGLVIVYYAFKEARTAPRIPVSTRAPHEPGNVALSRSLRLDRPPGAPLRHENIEHRGLPVGRRRGPTGGACSTAGTRPLPPVRV